jgi:hypothetical protein
LSNSTHTAALWFFPSRCHRIRLRVSFHQEQTCRLSSLFGFQAKIFPPCCSVSSRKRSQHELPAAFWPNIKARQQLCWAGILLIWALIGEKALFPAHVFSSAFVRIQSKLPKGRYTKAVIIYRIVIKLLALVWPCHLIYEMQ